MGGSEEEGAGFGVQGSGEEFGGRPVIYGKGLAMAERDGHVPLQSFRDLMAWQKAMSLAERVYEVTRGFPKEEIYGLTSQMRRAAVSAVSNIAEGYGRRTRGEYLQFLGTTRGSLAELQTQAMLSARLKMMDPQTEHALNESIEEVGRLVNALRNSLVDKPRNSH